MFHAATKSIWHKSRRTGVTVARLENSFPLRSISVRRFGNTKSIVVVTASPSSWPATGMARCSRSAGAAHAESVRDRLELFCFLMNARALPPEPRLMHKRPVRRIPSTR